MGITRSTTSGSQSVSSSYLDAIMEEHMLAPPEGAWTVQNMQDMGMCRSTARDRMKRGLSEGILETGKFRGKSYFWEKK